MFFEQSVFSVLFNAAQQLYTMSFSILKCTNNKTDSTVHVLVCVWQCKKKYHRHRRKSKELYVGMLKATSDNNKNTEISFSGEMPTPEIKRCDNIFNSKSCCAKQHQSGANAIYCTASYTVYLCLASSH